MSVAASIVIPAYNRVGPLRHTLASALRAVERLGESAEILLVDDGSEPPLATVLADLAKTPALRIVRQANQGSIVGRMTGLRAAQGEFVLFLDSDDLIAPAKLKEHVTRLRSASADISYDDLGEPARGDAIPEVSATQWHLPTADSVEELVLRVQPVPHGPIYRRSYLLAALTSPLLPPLRECDSVGDIWLYYNLCIHAARIVKIDAPLTLPGEHDETRYSQHWERLGFSSLRVMEVFIQRCPATPATAAARRLVGECAFNSWRKLPRGFDSSFRRRQLAVWRAAPDHAAMRLGGSGFRALARIFGYEGAGRILRLRNAPYSQCRTIDDSELARLSAAFAQPVGFEMKPNRFSFGHLLYRYFHRPRIWLQDRRDEAAGRQGEQAMRRAAASLPAVSLPDWGLKGPPCRFLTGARFVHQTIFCARSFEWACSTHVRLEIFGDGSLRTNDIAELKRTLPHATIADEGETVARLNRVLPAERFPLLREMREKQPLMRKLLDLHAGFNGPSLYLDSDMLFFGTPLALRDWLANPAGELFMHQHGDALVGARDQLERIFDQPLHDGVNSGIIAVNDEEFDWAALENAATRMTADQRAHKWAEQTLFACHVSRRRAKPLSRTDYFLCFSRAELDSKLPALRHYVHKSKSLYAAREWRLWLKRCEQSPS